MSDLHHTVGIREFRDNMHKYTRENDIPITVTSHGETVGFYIPARSAPKQQDFEALQAAATKMAQLLKENGTSEDEIVADFKNARNQESDS